MAIDQMMAYIQSLPIEEQQAAMQNLQGQMGGQGGMPPAPGMAPPPGQMPQQQQGRQMGMPGQNKPQGNQMGQDPMAMLQNNPQALEYIQSLSPEDRDAYINKLMRDYQGEGALQDEALNEADRLSAMPNAQGIQTQNAGFIASNPLSAIATAGSRIKGGMDRRAALAAKKALSESSTTARTTLAKSLLSPQEKKQIQMEGGDPTMM